MPTQDDWEHGKFSTGQMIGRLTLAVDRLAMTVNTLTERLKAVEEKRG